LLFNDDVITKCGNYKKVGKIQSEGVRFCEFGTKNTMLVPCCQKYTPTDCFFGRFAHWEGFEIPRRFRFFLLSFTFLPLSLTF